MTSFRHRVEENMVYGHCAVKFFVSTALGSIKDCPCSAVCALTTPNVLLTESTDLLRLQVVGKLAN